MGSGVAILLTACAAETEELGLPPPAPLRAPQPATNFETPEFFANYGLDQISAQHVYALGAYGEGVTVAVIDTGIDPAHPDLAGKISPDSVNVAQPSGPIDDSIGHGTHVAGIIGGRKNGIGMHGVAYDARLLVIKADSFGGLFTPQSLTSAIGYGKFGGAHVMNLSLGGPAPLGPAFEAALLDAVSFGSIIVAATGNETALEPGWPAAYAGDPRINASGQILAVGAVDSAGNYAGFSNRCGRTLHYCLMAPGVDVYSTIPTYPTDPVVGFGTQTDYATASGTSMAAPHVSGAAALLLQLFPTLQPNEVVQILLTTATDLGPAGVDTIFGHGLLNLQAAILPVGQMTIPLGGSVGGGSATLDATTLSLGAPFGDALSGSALLDRAVALDAFDRPYIVPLGASVTGAERSFGLEALVDADAVETLGTSLPGGVSVSMAISDPKPTASVSQADDINFTNGRGLELRGLRIARSSDRTVISLGFDIAADQQLGSLEGSDTASLFWMPSDMLGPQKTLIGSGHGFSVSRAIGANTVALRFFDERESPDAGSEDAQIGEIAVTRSFPGGASITASFSTLDESGEFLGSRAAGGFAVSGARSEFYSLSTIVPLAEGIEMIGSFTLADSAIAADGTTLLSDWSNVSAEAFGVGLAKRGVLGERDRLGVLVGQPLRVADAKATLTVPVSMTTDERVLTESERVSLVPSGREIDLQLAYDASLGDDTSVSTWVMMQLEPGHVAHAEPTYGLGMRLRTAF